MGDPAGGATRRVLTVPNLISAVRVAAIPAFMALIVDPDTTKAGLIVFGAVAATDWLDGVVARATGQVTELGKVLDPVADRLAIAACLVALVVRDAFPLWAASLIWLRDLVVLTAGLTVLLTRGTRVEVRSLGKVATFALMAAIAYVAWGNLGYAFAPAALVCGWTFFTVGIVEYYVTALLYAADLRTAAAPRRK